MPTATIQKYKATNQFYEEILSPLVQLRMMLIPAGKFLMGSPDSEPERFDRESPQHLVSVFSFFMGKYPVTQAQWRTVAAMPQVEIQLDPDPSKFKGDTRPVEQVSWHEATEFCARLSNHTKRQYRLPTEAEWEYACRAGTTTAFHFGKTISPELANYASSTSYAGGPTGKSRGETTPVDHFEIANAWGLCEMHGNVLEWCQDHWHSDYSTKPDRLKQKGNEAWIEQDVDKNDNHSHIVRGGSWVSDARYCRSASRIYGDPAYRSYYLGFRVVCGAPRTL